MKSHFALHTMFVAFLVLAASNTAMSEGESAVTNSAEWSIYFTPMDPPIICILGAVTTGDDVLLLDPPSVAEILRELPKDDSIVRSAMAEPDKFAATLEPIRERLDPARFYPLIGTAQPHHMVYRFTLYVKPDKKKSYFIDHNHLHITDPLTK